MTLGQKQKLFAKLVPRLLDKAHELGYEVTLGDAYRDPRSHGAMGVQGVYGAINSCHKVKLAIDLNLFLNGVYLDKTQDHFLLGTWWEEQGAAYGVTTVWGGKFQDGNHYSIEDSGHK